jgi:hypothetical protein
MAHRDEQVKDALCRPIIKLFERFPKDFAWLRAQDPETYEKVFQLVESAYRREGMIIDLADGFIVRVYGIDIPEIMPFYNMPEKRAEFLAENMRVRDTICGRIADYERASKQAVADLSKIAREANLQLLPIEEEDVSGSVGYSHPRNIAMTLSSVPQSEHRFLYTILAFAFGVTFLVVLLVLAVVIPHPAPFQVRVFTTVLAIAGAGAAAVMTGLLNVKATLGSQLAIGATGAMAVFVIIYLANPAVLPG